MTRLRGTLVDTWQPSGYDTLPGQLFGDRVVWAGGAKGNSVDTIYMRDTRRHRTTVLARARRGWRTDWVKGNGHWVAYTETDDEATDENPSPRWRIYVLDLARRGSRLVASSAQAHGGVPPSPVVEGSNLVWVQGSAAGVDRADLMVVDLDHPASPPRTIVRGRMVLDCGVTEGQIVYAEVVAGREDIFRVPIAGSTSPRRMTASGRVLRINVGDGLVAYEEGPPDGDPDGQFVLGLDPRERPVQITGPNPPGTYSPSNITPGRGLVSWFGLEGSVVARLSDPMATVTLTSQANVGLRFDWDGSRLLWGDTRVDRAGLHNTLHVTYFA